MRDIVVIGKQRFLDCRCDGGKLFLRLPDDPNRSYCREHSLPSFCLLCKGNPSYAAAEAVLGARTVSVANGEEKTS